MVIGAMDLQNPESHNGEPFEIIDDPVKIRRFLDRLHNNHALLSIQVGKEPQFYNSVILSIGANNDRLTIDELHPEEGHRKFLAQRTLHAKSEFEGIDLRFSAQLLEAGTESDIHLYAITFPKSVEYLQRRSSYRVRVLRSSEIPVTLNIPNSTPFKGELYNMSSDGIGMKFLQPLPKTMLRGLIVPECELKLPNEKEIVCALEVRHVIPNKGIPYTLVGGRFVKLNTTQQRSVNRFIATLERELRRKKT